MGSPFDTGTWNGVENAIFTGAGGGMMTVWLWVSIALCCLAIWMGHTHEMDAYKRSAEPKK